ncbi:MAG: hypothetical protein QOE06_3134, partial [Thermoleophilaceae bacterium]|nr:hypothetical protein [Thermoleophilaceae bacterium]
MSPRSRIILGAALAALVAVALLVPGKQRSADYTAGSVPRSAAAFVDSIGVVTHLQYRSTAYARQDEVLRRLRESGIRNLREAAPVNAPELEKGLRAAALFGVRGTLGFGLDVNPQVGVGAGVRAMGDAVAAFEGPNEVDTSGPPDWPARLKTFMPALRAAVRAQAGAGTPVVGPSFVNASLYRNVDPRTFDVANLHPYPGGLPPEPVFEAQRGRGLELAPGKKLAFTEIGYHNALTAKVGQPPASEQAAAVYLPRALLWAFAHHVDRTFVYELLDE